MYIYSIFHFLTKIVGKHGYNLDAFILSKVTILNIHF